MALSWSKKLSTLLHKNLQNIRVIFIVWIVLILWEQKNKLKSHEKLCKDKDFCDIVMPLEKNKILKFNQYMKSDEMPCIIYAHLESLIKKISLDAKLIHIIPQQQK